MKLGLNTWLWVSVTWRGAADNSLLKPLFLYVAGTWSMKNISCSSYSFNLRRWSLVIWFAPNSCTHTPTPGFSFLLLFSLFPNFPRKTPPRYMPWLTARLTVQALSITQSSQLHKHRSFHNLFSSAWPPFNEKKTKQKQDPELFQGCHLSVSQVTCENKSKGTVPFWNQGIPE